MLLIVLLVLTVCFIFSNSMESIPESRARSEKLLKALTPALELIVGEGNASNHLLRKMAHFAEFFALGAELVLLFMLRGGKTVWALFLGLCTALADETIQLFYERGSQVQDVWLDFSAVVCAAVIIHLLGALFGRRKVR